MAETNFIEFLGIDDFSFEDVKTFLERDHSSINEPDDEQFTPFFYVLDSPCCSRDIVRLLLQYGASTDARDPLGDTPLLCALKYSRDEAVIIELIDSGINANVQDSDGFQPLCLALQNNLSKEVIESLLKAGCSIQACVKHETIWHCFFLYGGYRCESDFSDVMKLLIEEGADVTKVDIRGRSPLCLALFNGAGVEDINLLLSRDASFKDCKKHVSPMVCVTDGRSGALLKADVVKLLLNTGASLEEDNVSNLTPLQSALRFCRYETTAIKILLDRSSRNKDLASIKHAFGGNLLHFAVANSFCKLSIVKLLLRKGVRSDEINKEGKTPLHKAMVGNNRDLRITKLLIRKGSPVNLKCKDGYTPLSLAVEYQNPDDVLLALLDAGALIDGLTDRHGVPLLNRVLKLHRIDSCEILLTWLLIENPNFNFKGLFKSHFDNVVATSISSSITICSEECELELQMELTSFAEDCILDLQRMKFVNVGKNLTLSEFIKGNCDQDFDLDKILRAFSKNQFFDFSDVISSKIMKFLLMNKLQQLSVYIVKSCFDYPSAELKTEINYDCLCKIAKYLTKKDLLCLILAFNFTCDFVRIAKRLIRSRSI